LERLRWPLTNQQLLLLVCTMSSVVLHLPHGHFVGHPAVRSEDCGID